MIDQNATHQLCRNSEEVCATLPVSVGLIDQTKIGLVDKRSGLECVARVVATHIAVSELAQLLEDECNEMLKKHTAYVREHFEDMPEIRDWAWTN